MTDILVEHEGPVATVVFNRPKMRNAISLAMWTEIARVTEGLAKDESVRAIVYRGAGREAFASGADISEFKEHRKDTATALRYNAQTSAAYTAIRECAKPTVAMIFGFCMGGAMAVAMACDLRFAAEGSKFGIPAARLGIIYGGDAGVPREAGAQVSGALAPARALRFPHLHAALPDRGQRHVRRPRRSGPRPRAPRSPRARLPPAHPDQLSYSGPLALQRRRVPLAARGRRRRRCGPRRVPRGAAAARRLRRHAQGHHRR